MIPNLSRIHVPIDPDIVNQVRARRRYDRKCEILPSVLEAIGETPLISLSRLAKHYNLPPGTELLGKIEFYNAGGSIKDRVARAMIESQERLGTYSKNSIIIEASSGNTGIGLAIAAAATSRQCLVTLPDKIGMEKESILRSLGCEVIRTPNVPWYDPHGPIGEACHQSASLGDRGLFFNQYKNPANSSAHYAETAQELLDQTQSHIDYCIMGLGTCGTAAGIGARFRKDLPSCKIVVVEPQGSVMSRLQDPEFRSHRKLLNKGEPCPVVEKDDLFIQNLSALSRPWKVEGIGKDFLPPLLDERNVDEWMIVSDKDSFEVARNAIRTEGLLIGGSCGTVLAAAISLARGEAAGKRIVVILPDGARNYISTFLDDGWMVLNGYLSVEELKLKPRDVKKDSLPLRELLPYTEAEPSFTMSVTSTCEDVVAFICKAEPQEYIKVMDGPTLYGVLAIRCLRIELMRDPDTLRKNLKDVGVTIKCPAGITLDADKHTWLHGLHVIDEFDRIYHGAHDGFIIVADHVVTRQTFIRAKYPIELF